MTKNTKKSTQTKYTTAEVPRNAHSLVGHLSVDTAIPTKELYGIIIPLGFHIYQLLSKEIETTVINPENQDILISVMKNAMEIYSEMGGTMHEVLMHLHDLAEGELEKEIIMSVWKHLFDEEDNI